MAFINRKRIKPERVKPICSEAIDSCKFYNSMAWHRFRNVYVSEHPVCAECLLHDHVEPTAEVHHILPFSHGTTEEEQWKLFLDQNNVIALCKQCHIGYHIKMKRYGLERCGGLTEKEWREAHDMDV